MSSDDLLFTRRLTSAIAALRSAGCEEAADAIRDGDPASAFAGVDAFFRREMKDLRSRASEGDGMAARALDALGLLWAALPGES